MTTAHASQWRREHTVQQPTSKVSGGRGAVATEVSGSNRPLPRQARLLKLEAAGCP
jgi:hypothetical protein